jgi:hypothetical protein
MSVTAVTIEKTGYAGWPNCYRISNGNVEVIVTSDVGPRLIRFGFVGGQNLFREFAGQLGKSGEADWQPRGGHRIWFAPEDPLKTYAPDNAPVEIRLLDGGLEAIEPVEPLTGLIKEIAVTVAPAGSAVTVTHRIRNAGTEPFTLAPWALSMMAPGGWGIHGFPPRGTHPEMLAPSNPLVMWPFSNLADPRWKYTRKYLLLHGDPAVKVPMKLGSWNRHTWGAYLLNGEVFIKRCEAPGRPEDYTDFGCSFETFTNGEILELETLGPLRALAPGETAGHVERWTLDRGVTLSRFDDEEIDRTILPLVEAR